MSAVTDVDKRSGYKIRHQRNEDGGKRECGRTGCFYQNAKNLNGSKQFLGTAEPTLKRDKTEVQTLILPETGPLWKRPTDLVAWNYTAESEVSCHLVSENLIQPEGVTLMYAVFYNFCIITKERTF